MVIALIVTPEGFPLAYEVLPGNTLDKQTLPTFIEHIEVKYGKAERIWIMDRGITTEEQLKELREKHPEMRADRPVDWMDGSAARGRAGPIRQLQPVPDPALSGGLRVGELDPGTDRSTHCRGLAGQPRWISCRFFVAGTFDGLSGRAR